VLPDFDFYFVLGCLASVLVGVVLGMLGGGGSILSIPILVYLFGVEPVLASAYSLFVVGITSLVGAIPKYRQQLVNVRTGLIFGVPSILAIFLTRSLVVPAIPEVIVSIGEWQLTKRLLLLGVFALLMVLASVPMIRGRQDLESDSQRFRYFLLVVEGILIGFLTGLVGAGGGFLIIPALVFLTGLKFKTAVGTSLLIIAVNSLLGFVGDLASGQQDIQWSFLLLIAFLAVAGIFLGNRWAGRVSATRLKRAFGWLTLVMGVYILLRESL
jgi:uncharacterized membrane protein YfcA